MLATPVNLSVCADLSNLVLLTQSDNLVMTGLLAGTAGLAAYNTYDAVQAMRAATDPNGTKDMGAVGIKRNPVPASLDRNAVGAVNNAARLELENNAAGLMMPAMQG
ncbi:hypothetical protein KDH83_29335 [Achromobacter sp. Marseille-Q0513]|uniref:hypothetical protein n=1 Tax=Achromobacter sp. Marseille-Q0513 TaxID=2829161 RepID=UPI001B9BBD4B|nr:hypothetical protein [Achromobacter sp. Marseille-Q0513]MBR8657426.1 hypothetical protein [Achromobacter sp. Marseille-Q0513]